MSKLKPVPEDLLRLHPAEIDERMRTGKTPTLWDLDEVINKVNQQNKYLDYLRKEIQDLKDRGR